MDQAQLTQIRSAIAEAEAKIKLAETDIANMERAGLTAQAQALRSELNSSKDQLAKMKNVYG